MVPSSRDEFTIGARSRGQQRRGSTAARTEDYGCFLRCAARCARDSAARPAPAGRAARAPLPPRRARRGGVWTLRSLWAAVSSLATPVVSAGGGRPLRAERGGVGDRVGRKGSGIKGGGDWGSGAPHSGWRVGSCTFARWVFRPSDFVIARRGRGGGDEGRGVVARGGRRDDIPSYVMGVQRCDGAVGYWGETEIQGLSVFGDRPMG